MQTPACRGDVGVRGVDPSIGGSAGSRLEVAEVLEMAGAGGERRRNIAAAQGFRDGGVARQGIQKLALLALGHGERRGLGLVHLGLWPFSLFFLSFFLSVASAGGLPEWAVERGWARAPKLAQVARTVPFSFFLFNSFLFKFKFEFEFKFKSDFGQLFNRGIPYMILGYFELLNTVVRTIFAIGPFIK